MTHTQFKAALKRLNMSGAKLARTLVVNRRTVSRWASGESVVPATVALLLDCWLDSGQRGPKGRR